MEIPMTPQDNKETMTPVKPQVDIKAEFMQGPPDAAGNPFNAGPPPMTPEQKEQIEKQQEAQMDYLSKQYKKKLPFLRMQHEYFDLLYKTTEFEVMLGIRPASSVPGLQGMQFGVKEAQAQGFLTQFTNDMENLKAEWKKEWEQEQIIAREMADIKAKEDAQTVTDKINNAD